ncbi:MAG TPA: thymidine phosphorylase [Cyanobacteria bacterium UBA8530]|nr:thymidine phosphorylase [Cyanobacteria bacterium UBA8530]
MNILKLIRDKRDGRAHSIEELGWLIGNLDSLPDYQISAWLMAVVCRGMNVEETTELTRLMAVSGDVLDLSSVPGPRVDKHSTGGVGDKVTLVLAPLLAAAGVTVAKLSGRGLGHTGGTIDKLEAISGFRTSLSPEEFLEQLRQIGCAVAGQTGELAPADGRLYALRDVTGTVESIPLIAASVVSKKIAAGADVILLDVKVGQGAFMKSLEEAKALADVMLAVGERLGKRIICVVSDMEQPLGFNIGHANEVEEAILTLQGQGPEDLTDLCVELGALLLEGAGKVEDVASGRKKLAAIIESGAAIAKLREMILAQGGDPAVIENPKSMPQPKYRIPVQAKEAGFVTALDAFVVGGAGKILGAGRLVKGAPIDLAVGINLVKKVGDKVEVGEILGVLLANDEGQAKAAAAELLAAYRIANRPVEAQPTIKAVFTKSALLA